MAFTDDTAGGRIIREGLMPVRIVLTDTCKVGDLIGYDAVTSDAWERADANGKVPPELIAGEPCAASGDIITCYKMAYVGGFTGATAGDTVYAADTAGQYAATPGSTWHHAVGQCVSATEAFVCPSSIPVSVYSGTGTGMAGFFRVEVESGRTAVNRICGIETHVKTISGAVVAVDVFGIYIFMQLQQVPTGGSSAMLRLEDGCSASCGVGAWIAFIGGPDADPPDFLFEFGAQNPTNEAWQLDANSSLTAAGRIKCNFGGATRYISLNSD